MRNCSVTAAPIQSHNDNDDDDDDNKLYKWCIFMIEAYCNFTFILSLNVVYTLSYFIVFCHGVYHFTANRK